MELAILGCLYFLPALIAWRRRHHNQTAISLCNLLLGWTVLGWVLTLIWAATAVRRPAPAVVMYAPVPQTQVCPECGRVCRAGADLCTGCRTRFPALTPVA